MARRFPQGAMMNIDFAKWSVALSGVTGVSIYSALQKGGYKPGLAVASLFVTVNLGLGVHLSTIGRHRRTIAFLNFCTCFVPLIIAMAHGGEFDPTLVKKIYDALPSN